MGAGPVIAILVLTLVHFAAFALLFWHIAGREMFATFRIASDEDGGGGAEPLPGGDPGGDRDGGMPLPDADPAPVRLREPGRIAEAYPRRPRRPGHVPDEPSRIPARG